MFTLAKHKFVSSINRVIIWHQPKQCTSTGEIPQNYYTFVLFDPPKIGILMTPD